MAAAVTGKAVSIARTQFTVCNPQRIAQPSQQTSIVRACSPLGMSAQQPMKFGQYGRFVFITAQANICSEFSHIKQAQTSPGLVNTIQADRADINLLNC
jgi:hypothetical protein